MAYIVEYKITKAGMTVDRFVNSKQISNKDCFRKLEKHDKGLAPVTLWEKLPEYDSWQAVAVVKPKWMMMKYPKGKWQVQK